MAYDQRKPHIVVILYAVQGKHGQQTGPISPSSSPDEILVRQAEIFANIASSVRHAEILSVRGRVIQVRLGSSSLTKDGDFVPSRVNTTPNDTARRGRPCQSRCLVGRCRASVPSSVKCQRRHDKRHGEARGEGEASTPSRAQKQCGSSRP
jgi:hypothetical protein